MSKDPHRNKNLAKISDRSYRALLDLVYIYVKDDQGAAQQSEDAMWLMKIFDAYGLEGPDMDKRILMLRTRDRLHPGFDEALEQFRRGSLQGKSPLPEPRKLKYKRKLVIPELHREQLENELKWLKQKLWSARARKDREMGLQLHMEIMEAEKKLRKLG